VRVIRYSFGTREKLPTRSLTRSLGDPVCFRELRPRGTGRSHAAFRLEQLRISASAQTGSVVGSLQRS